MGEAAHDRGHTSAKKKKMSTKKKNYILDNSRIRTDEGNAHQISSLAP